MIPTAVFHKPLQGANAIFSQEFEGHWLCRFGLQIAHQPGDISQTQSLMLDASKAVMKLLMKFDQFFGYALISSSVSFTQGISSGLQ